MAAAAMASAAARRLRGVVFDMDGTLTLPGSIDFARMYERAGVKRGSCILSHARAASEAERARIFAVIDEEERVGMDRCELQAGLVEAMASVDALKLPRALVTRNSHAAAQHFLARSGLQFSLVLTRDFEGGFKPSPAPLLHAAQRWGVEGADLLMVGDSRDDLEAGAAAGAATALVLNTRNTELRARADFVVEDMAQLAALIAKLAAAR